MGEFSISHLLILGLILTVVFGPERLPQLAKGLGKGIRDFKKAANGEDEPPEDKKKLS